VSPAAPMPTPPATLLRLWGYTNPRKGDNMFIELLQRGGANDAFAYTGGTFMECIGVCIITLWHGATNIITTLAHTLLSSAPMVTITG
jgi:thiamine pyrophosphate-dependent acetolactate synthase large subunit-like protein